MLPIAHHIDIEKLTRRELPTYLSIAARAQISTDDVEAYSIAILNFWRNTPAQEMKTWRKAARIVFAMTPNSASCERVSSLLKVMWGEQQHVALADSLQASLMLRYNQRMN